jgi:hypothetical protein
MIIHAEQAFSRKPPESTIRRIMENRERFLRRAIFRDYWDKRGEKK